MTTAASPSPSRVAEGFRHQAGLTSHVIGLNLDGITHDESLIAPSPAGNCLNWVLGHLLCVYDQLLPLLGQEPAMPEGTLKRYARGTPPLTNPGEAVRFEALVAAWGRAAERVDTGLAALTEDLLDQPAPASPSNDPNETVRSLVSTIMFHQAYHTGQIAMLRRVVGRDGAIR